MKARVTIVTAGHLSTCPRMLKAADALHGAGYRVRVVSTRHVPWAWSADRSVMQSRSWEWRVVDYDRRTARVRQAVTGARFRAAQMIATTVGPARLPFGVAARAYSRVHDELVDAITSEPADFVYGGTTGALAAVAAGARTLRVPYALDFEDFHSAELTGPGSALAHALAERIERAVVPQAAFLTAASPMIADAYGSKYRRRPQPIHNTFSLRLDVASNGKGPLRLYWFSQTLGPGRGLDEVVRAIGRCGISAELHLRARPIPSYVAHLSRLQAVAAPSLTIVHHDPAPPDQMVELAQGYDLGLSCEQPDVLNRQICLTNKIFTYLAAGVPVLMSATPAQARLAVDLGDAAVMYDCGDVDQLAMRLRHWNTEAALRLSAKDAARHAAERRWHWEHAEDRGALLSAFRMALG